MRRLWRYLKIAKWAYLGWGSSFVICLVHPDIEKTPGYYLGTVATLLGITVLVVGLLWFMESKFGRQPEP